MSTTFPASKQTFTDPSGTSLLSSGPDHASLHADINDTVEAIQDTAGTTAGTNVLKNFAAGDFPARINASNVLQQTLQGTVNNSVLGTPAITGGTITSPVLNVTSDAQGDVYYRDASGNFSRLAAGTNGHFLQTQGTGANPQWAASSTYKAMLGGNAGGAFVQSTVRYIQPAFPATSDPTETSVQQIFPASTLHEVRVHVTANNDDGACIVTVRKNAADTTLIGTITASATGDFSGTSSVAVAADDKIAIELDATAGSAGTVTVRSVALVYSIP